MWTPGVARRCVPEGQGWLLAATFVPLGCGWGWWAGESSLCFVDLVAWECCFFRKLWPVISLQVPVSDLLAFGARSLCSKAFGSLLRSFLSRSLLFSESQQITEINQQDEDS